MRRKVHLHGALGAQYGEVFEMNVSTAAEAVRFLAVQIKGLGDALKAGSFHVVRSPRDGTPDLGGMDLDIEMVKGYRLGTGDLHIMPYIAGSKQGGMLKVILGVALIGAAFFFSGGALGTAIPMLGGHLSFGNMAMVGVALAAAGASQLLAPEEKDEKSDDSFLFSGPGNTYAEGSAIPLVYGEVYTGGVLISVGMDAENLKKSTGSNAGTGTPDEIQPEPKTDADLPYDPDPWGHS